MPRIWKRNNVDSTILYIVYSDYRSLLKIIYYEIDTFSFKASKQMVHLGT